MSFVLANFAPVGNTSKPLSGVGTSELKGAPSVWAYATADAKNTVTAADYFLPVINQLRVGDLVYCISGAGSGGTLAASLLTVNANNGTTIDVSDGNVVSQTDTY